MGVQCSHSFAMFNFVSWHISSHVNHRGSPRNVTHLIRIPAKGYPSTVKSVLHLFFLFFIGLIMNFITVLLILNSLGHFEDSSVENHKVHLIVVILFNNTRCWKHVVLTKKSLKSLICEDFFRFGEVPCAEKFSVTGRNNFSSWFNFLHSLIEDMSLVSLIPILHHYCFFLQVIICYLPSLDASESGKSYDKSKIVRIPVFFSSFFK